jgi:hypothetical protein
MSRRLNFAKTYQVEWENSATQLSKEEWEELIELSEEEQKDFEDTDLDIWHSENDDFYEVPKLLLEKKMKKLEVSNKKLLDFCKELLEKSDKRNNYVRVEFF